MQSDGSSLCGDVVLGSFNKASRDEEEKNIEQMYEIQICLDFYDEDFNFL